MHTVNANRSNIMSPRRSKICMKRFQILVESQNARTDEYFEFSNQT